jgi:uronate dehydrogenase
MFWNSVSIFYESRTKDIMTSTAPLPKTALKTVLLTGAAGTLGRALTPPLRAVCERLVLSDLAAPLAALGDPRAVPCDLADGDAVHSLLDGVDAIVHLGGVSVEKPFDVVLPANIVGVFNLYEAARRRGVKRIVFASSNHVTGCYRQDEKVHTQDPARPDGYYGLSKLYGEGLASMYWDRFGIETVALRIGSGTPAPIDRRALSTWLSLGDLARLVTAALTAPGVGFLVAYGTSDNARSWWDTADAWAKLGYQPQDRSEDHAAAVQHILQPEGVMRELQGGLFLGIGPFDD